MYSLAMPLHALIIVKDMLVLFGDPTNLTFLLQLLYIF